MRRVSIALICLAALAGCGSGSRAPVEIESRAAPMQVPEFGNLDPRAWDGRPPQAYPVHGIDVSRWQGDIDWKRAGAAGVSFAYIKATEGGDHLDPMFRAHWDGAGQAGVRRGAYHYFYFCRPAEEQARWFIENVPRDRRALPHVLDMEWTPFSPTCTRRPDGAFLRAEADRFLDLLERHYGRRPVVYTTVDFYRDTGIGALPDTEFWLRSVAGHPQITYPGADWTLWQYTSTGLVPGIDGSVDINVFAGDARAWSRWAAN